MRIRPWHAHACGWLGCRLQHHCYTFHLSILRLALSTAMAAPTADPVLRENMDAVYTHFDAHDWDADTEFQAGIAGIVEAQRAQGASEPDIAATIDRAKAFYFSSKCASPSSLGTVEFTLTAAA